MRGVLVGIAALAWGLVVGAGSASAQTAAEAVAAMQTRLATAPGFSGVIGVTRAGDTAVAAIGDHRAGDNWRWASVTKMITAILVLQQVDDGRLALDAPIADYLPTFPVNADRITVRQLLTHTSGLANPDRVADADEDGMPDFYQRLGGWRAVCESAPAAEPGVGFSYNNCDYLVLGDVLQAVSGQSYPDLVNSRLVRPLGLGDLTLPTEARVDAQLDGKPEPAVIPATFGPAGGLYGTAEDLLKIDRALMDGRLMSEASRAEMWKGDPAAGFAALSVWAYAPNLGACLGTTRLIERYGEIGGVQVRNFILPDKGVALTVYSSDGATTFGEVWQGQGLSIDLIRAAACGAAPAA